MTSERITRIRVRKAARKVFLPLLCLWVWTAVTARAETSVGFSPVFAFDTQDASGTTIAFSNGFPLDTRDASGTTIAYSNAFALDTRDASGTTVAVSNLFILDTRAPNNGLTTSNVSNLFPLDTLTALAGAGGLMIIGPATVAAGSQTEYRIVLNSSGGTADVSLNSSLTFSGGPLPYAGIGGDTVFVNRDAPAGATMQLQAVYRGSSGQTIYSPNLAVTISAALFAQMSASSRSLGGTNYEIALDGTATGGPAPFSFRWDTNNDGVYGDKTGQHVTFNQTTAGGTTVKVRLEVTDGTGSKAYARGSVTIDKPPVPNEPVRTNPLPDVAIGALLNADGTKFQPDANKAANGFILLTHGLRSGGREAWLAGTDGMENRLKRRLEQDRGAGQMPNIAIYDWSENSDPSGQISPFHRVLLEALARVGSSLHSPVGQAAELTPYAAEALDFAVDLSYIKPIALADGQTLATYIWDQANAGLIDSDQPIHLIGHSAGGFVIGQCALWLQQHPLRNGKTVVVDRVTMLDTPFPVREHLTTLPDPTVVERFISSNYGGLEIPSTWLVSPNSYYQKSFLGTYWPFNYFPDERGHGLSYVWYNHTIHSETEDDSSRLEGFGIKGFSLSPFLGGYVAPRNRVSFASLLTQRRDFMFNQGLEEEPVSGFSTFGNVAFDGGTWTLAEQANAGLVKHLTIPVGTRSLKFQFKFSSGGDGDFLNIRFGNVANLYVGLDTALSRDGFTWIEAPVDGLDGLTDDLAIELVSRGTPNAAVQISDVSFIVSDDPDNDSLTNAQEQALGTDSMNPDSDGDGLTDGEEVNHRFTNPMLADSDGDGIADGDEIKAGTNPLDAHSGFRVLTAQRQSSGYFTITWSSNPDRYYKVVRSETLDFTNAQVVASDMPGAGSTTTFTDTSVQANSQKMFYRVELE